MSMDILYTKTNMLLKRRPGCTPCRNQRHKDAGVAASAALDYKYGSKNLGVSSKHMVSYSSIFVNLIYVSAKPSLSCKAAWNTGEM